ncbi:hypothetical protein EG329_012839 [Mollisiaceae sp. DMI_Dod_QoI]|nr:hypothetical protein EG329_012839 [Helotiales sp. DMI_Dod_QoI]
MLFSKFTVFSLLIWISAVLSQVVVTVTNTITVITVTVQPQTTSTSTAFVTVTGGSPPPTSTRSTITVTLTTSIDSTPSSAGCSVKYLGQCDGDAFNGCNNCDSGLQCTYYTHWYSQCLRPGQKVKPPGGSTVVVRTSTIYA